MMMMFNLFCFILFYFILFYLLFFIIIISFLCFIIIIIFKLKTTHSPEQPSLNILLYFDICTRGNYKKMFYLTTHSTYFIYTQVLARAHTHTHTHTHTLFPWPYPPKVQARPPRDLYVKPVVSFSLVFQVALRNIHFYSIRTKVCVESVAMTADTVV